eukprot:SAG11_NODE_2117_length_3792_cov_2.955321_8_plen_75_part_00
MAGNTGRQKYRFATQILTEGSEDRNIFVWPSLRTAPARSVFSRDPRLNDLILTRFEQKHENPIVLVSRRDSFDR